MATEKIFGVVFPIQKKQISTFCWGARCGRGQVGAIDLGDGFQAVPCREQTCHFAEKEMEHPIGQTQGADLYLRKLIEVEGGFRGEAN